MAQEVEFGKGGEGKIRSFWVGTGWREYRSGGDDADSGDDD